MLSPSLPLLRSFFLPPSRAAWLLGYGGLVPFVGLGAAVWLLEGARQTQALYALLAYGAVILSFLGAIHWGLAMRDLRAPSASSLSWGVIPGLLAWAALLCGTAIGMGLLAAGFWICFAVDSRVYPRFGLRAWLGMRLILTSLASLTCLAAAMGAGR